MTEALDPNDWHQWRGGVDVRLEQSASAIRDLSGDTKEIKATLGVMNASLTALTTTLKDAQAIRKAVTAWQVAIISAVVAGLFSALAVLVSKI